MAAEVEKELETISDYIDRQLTPLCRAFVSGTPYKFDDPDTTTLEIATRLLTRLDELADCLEDHLGILQAEGTEVKPDEVFEKVCEYYQTLAERLYATSQKVRKCVEMNVRVNNEQAEHVDRKIKEKTEEALKKKMGAYHKLK
jgi:hypothetical protein